MESILSALLSSFHSNIFLQSLHSHYCSLSDQSIHPTHLRHILFGAAVRGLEELAGDLEVAVDDKRLVWPVGIDAHTTHVVDGLRVTATLEGVLNIALKLAWVGCLPG